MVIQTLNGHGSGELGIYVYRSINLYRDGYVIMENNVVNKVSNAYLGSHGVCVCVIQKAS